MERSTDRILTTHTGSLPRPDALLKMLRARDDGEPIDADTYDRAVRSAVTEAVSNQLEAGLDIVNDGEMSKIGYSTYVKERLTGFEGTQESPPLVLPDLAEFPEYTARFTEGRAVSTLKRPLCVGPITYRGQAQLKTDLENLRAALEGRNPGGVFMSAASPGVISAFLGNDYYRSHESYIEALAEAMKVEYEAIHQAGFVLQLDCPDLAMGGHIMYPGLSVEEFRKKIGLHVEAINHALSAIPPETTRMHLCWGNYEGPHHHDVPLRQIIDLVFKARPATILYEAANPRHEHEWKVFREIRLPQGKMLVPGVIDSTTNFVEHPEVVAQRICSLAEVVGRENVVAGVDCGFGTFAGLNSVDSKIVWFKLRSLDEGARLASEILWGGRT